MGDSPTLGKFSGEILKAREKKKGGKEKGGKRKEKRRGKGRRGKRKGKEKREGKEKGKEEKEKRKERKEGGKREEKEKKEGKKKREKKREEKRKKKKDWFIIIHNMEARCTCTTCNVLMGPTQLAQNDRVWTLFYAFFQFDIEFFTLWFWGRSQRNIVLTFIIISHLFYI